MKSVPIAELKSRLSAYIQLARAGEEILIRDRNLPVAKLVPLGGVQGRKGSPRWSCSTWPTAL